MNIKETEEYKNSKIVLMLMLLKFCGRNGTPENMKYINNDFFHKISGQLYSSCIGKNCGYLNDEQIKLVRRAIDEKWDGTAESFDKILNSIQ